MSKKLWKNTPKGKSNMSGSLQKGYWKDEKLQKKLQKKISKKQKLEKKFDLLTNKDEKRVKQKEVLSKNQTIWSQKNAN